MNTKTETLHDCAKCGGKKFTAAGLRSHNCERRAARALVILEKTVAAPAVHDFAAMGKQFSEQYQRAINAMPEVLKFGVMVMHVEKLTHDGSVSEKGGGRGKKGGLREWLRNYAPDVPLVNAQRFRDVARGIETRYAEIVGGKVAKTYELTDLVGADPEKLAPAVAKKRTALFAFVSGTSQKSWLDQIRAPKEDGGAGGARHAKCPHCSGALRSKKTAICPHCKKHTGEEDKTPEQQIEEARASVAEWAEGLIGESKIEHKLWRLLRDDQLAGLAAHLRTFAGAIEGWVKTPKKQREEMTHAEILTA